MSVAAWRWILQRPASLSDLPRLSKITGSSSFRSPSALTGWWRRRPADSQILTLPKPARLYCSGPSQVRQFGTANQRQRHATKRHLYLVLDDKPKKYSIYKLDMDNDLDEGRGSLETPLSLPQPPALRIGPPTIGLGAQFAALGSHIIGTRPATDAIPRVRPAEPHVTLTYDTKTDLLGVSDIFPDILQRTRYETAIAVRNKLYVFESHTFNETCIREGSIFGFQGGLHCLAIDSSDDDERDWAWQPLSVSSRFSWSWTCDPPEFPFDPKLIIAHVVHPRTGTIFMSVGGRVRGTFSYGTGGSGKWKRRGDWMFPFKGKAHYDDVLGAWVGLRFHRGQGIIGNGYLCACSVMSGWQPPKWKVNKEKLFIEQPYWIRVDAKLVHMGEHNKYCLVECLLPKGEDKMKCVLRLTMFIIKYGDDGELQTMAHQPSSFYKAPSYHPRFDVQAFWM